MRTKFSMITTKLRAPKGYLITITTFVFVFILVGCAETSQFTKGLSGKELEGIVGTLLNSRTVSTKSGRLPRIAGIGLETWVGTIGRYLEEQDRQRHAEAAYRASSTGKSQTWRNSKTGASGSAKVVKTETKKRKVSVPVLKDRIKEVPPLDLIGEPYKANSSINVRGGPGTDYVIVDKLRGGQTVTVTGKVQGKSWYMISQNGVGTGFVSAGLLKRAPSAAPQEESTPAGPVEKKTVTAERTCRTVEQTVVLKNGSTKTETVKACRGADGWEIV